MLPHRYTMGYLWLAGYAAARRRRAEDPGVGRRPDRCRVGADPRTGPRDGGGAHDGHGQLVAGARRARTQPVWLGLVWPRCWPARLPGGGLGHGYGRAATSAMPAACPRRGRPRATTASTPTSRGRSRTCSSTGARGRFTITRSSPACARRLPGRRRWWYTTRSGPPRRGTPISSCPRRCWSSATTSAPEALFFAANLTKLTHGAWLPLLIGITAFTILTTWQRGRELVTRERSGWRGRCRSSSRNCTP